jgi:rhamnogalacturonan endolyase
MNALKKMALSIMVATASLWANVPGGGSTGADVTVTDNGATVVLNNGIVAITITKASGTITSLTYGGQNLFAGGSSGGQYYWELESGDGVYTLAADPKLDSGNCAEVQLFMKGSPTGNPALDVTIDYALLRGSTGFYAAGILSHPSSYAAVTGGEWRAACYVGSIFNWLSVDSKRNKLMPAPADWVNGVAVAGAPKEVELLTTGIYKGQYECKYTYSADFGEESAWGWSSTAQDIGIWTTLPSIEYYNGGPKKRELTCHMATDGLPTLLNMLGGSHYGMGSSETIAAGATVRKIYGPWLVYINNVAAGTANPQNALFNDAIAQSKAEQTAWPYTWFRDTGYLQASRRGTVTGTLAISDPGAPNASPAGMWIGLAPDNGTDFQLQFFTYQFWVKTGATGAFTIPNVLPGTYALYAFGPGAAGTFKQTPVTVAAGQSLNLGTVTWIPLRTASTIWEIGTPDRDSHEFLNGDSLYGCWQTSYINYPTEFPNGVTYTVGTSKTDSTWNYSMMNANTWKVNFSLPNAPTAGSNARFYLALASNDGSKPQVSLNGTLIGNLSPGNPSDAVVRLGSHGAFWDTSLIFKASLLKAGANTLSISQAAGATLEWDYLRMEANGTGIVTGVTRSSSFEPIVHRAVSRQGSVLRGDGFHVLELISPDGRIIAQARGGQSLDLSHVSQGVYFARCGAEVLPVVRSK